MAQSSSVDVKKSFQEQGAGARESREGNSSSSSRITEQDKRMQKCSLHIPYFPTWKDFSQDYVPDDTVLTKEERDLQVEKIPILGGIARRYSSLENIFPLVHGDSIIHGSKWNCGGEIKDSVALLSECLQAQPEWRLQMSEERQLWCMEILQQLLRTIDKISRYELTACEYKTGKPSLVNYITELTEDILQMQPGSIPIVLPGGYYQHAVLYVIERNANGTWTFTVINSSPNYHAKVDDAHKVRVDPCLSFTDLTAEDLVFSEQNPRGDFFATLLYVLQQGKRSGINGNVLYATIFEHFEGKQPVRSTDMRCFIKEQEAGTCSYKVVLALLRRYLPLEEYKRFVLNVKLLTLKTFKESKKEIFCEKRYRSPDDREWRSLMRYAAQSLVRGANKGMKCAYLMPDHAKMVLALAQATMEEVDTVDQSQVQPSQEFCLDWQVESKTNTLLETEWSDPRISEEIQLPRPWNFCLYDRPIEGNTIERSLEACLSKVNAYPDDEEFIVVQTQMFAQALPLPQDGVAIQNGERLLEQFSSLLELYCCSFSKKQAFARDTYVAHILLVWIMHCVKSIASRGHSLSGVMDALKEIEVLPLTIPFSLTPSNMYLTPIDWALARALDQYIRWDPYHGDRFLHVRLSFSSKAPLSDLQNHTNPLMRFCTQYYQANMRQFDEVFQEKANRSFQWGGERTFFEDLIVGIVPEIYAFLVGATDCEIFGKDRFLSVLRHVLQSVSLLKMLDYDGESWPLKTELRLEHSIEEWRLKICGTSQKTRIDKPEILSDAIFRRRPIEESAAVAARMEGDILKSERMANSLLTHSNAAMRRDVQLTDLLEYGSVRLDTLKQEVFRATFFSQWMKTVLSSEGLTEPFGSDVADYTGWQNAFLHFLRKAKNLYSVDHSTENLQVSLCACRMALVLIPFLREEGNPFWRVLIGELETIDYWIDTPEMLVEEEYYLLHLHRGFFINSVYDLAESGTLEEEVEKKLFASWLYVQNSGENACPKELADLKRHLLFSLSVYLTRQEKRLEDRHLFSILRTAGLPVEVSVDYRIFQEEKNVYHIENQESKWIVDLGRGCVFYLSEQCNGQVYLNKNASSLLLNPVYREVFGERSAKEIVIDFGHFYFQDLSGNRFRVSRENQTQYEVCRFSSSTRRYEIREKASVLERCIEGRWYRYFPLKFRKDFHQSSNFSAKPYAGVWKIPAAILAHHTIWEGERGIYFVDEYGILKYLLPREKSDHLEILDGDTTSVGKVHLALPTSFRQYLSSIEEEYLLLEEDRDSGEQRLCFARYEDEEGKPCRFVRRGDEPFRLASDPRYVLDPNVRLLPDIPNALFLSRENKHFALIPECEYVDTQEKPLPHLARGASLDIRDLNEWETIIKGNIEQIDFAVLADHCVKFGRSTKRFYIIEVIHNQLIASTASQAFYSAYLYLGQHDYIKAYAALEKVVVTEATEEDVDLIDAALQLCNKMAHPSARAITLLLSRLSQELCTLLGITVTPLRQNTQKYFHVLARTPEFLRAFAAEEKNHNDRHRHNRRVAMLDDKDIDMQSVQQICLYRDHVLLPRQMWVEGYSEDHLKEIGLLGFLEILEQLTYFSSWERKRVSQPFNYQNLSCLYDCLRSIWPNSIERRRVKYIFSAYHRFVDGEHRLANVCLGILQKNPEQLPDFKRYGMVMDRWGNYRLDENRLYTLVHSLCEGIPVEPQDIYVLQRHSDEILRQPLDSVRLDKAEISYIVPQPPRVPTAKQSGIVFSPDSPWIERFEKSYQHLLSDEPNIFVYGKGDIQSSTFEEYLHEGILPFPESYGPLVQRAKLCLIEDYENMQEDTGVRNERSFPTFTIEHLTKHIEESSRQLEEIKAQLLDDEAKILEQANFISDPNKRLLAELEYFARTHQKISMPLLLRVYLSQNTCALQRLNPSLDEAQVGQVFLAIREYLLQAIYMQKMQRIQTALDHSIRAMHDAGIATNREAIDEDGMIRYPEVIRTSLHMQETLQQTIDFSIEEHPEFLVFLYVNEMMFRPGQAKAIAFMLDTEKTHTILQRMMGGGKTTVLLATVLMKIALSREDTSPLLITPAFQMQTVCSNLSKVLRKLDIRLVKLKYTREQLTQEILFWIDSVLDAAQSGSKKDIPQVIVMDPELPKVLMLEYATLMKQLHDYVIPGEDSSLKEVPSHLSVKLNLLRGILRKFRDHATVYADEVQEVLNIRRELIYSSGEEVPISERQRDLTRQIFTIIGTERIVISPEEQILLEVREECVPLERFFDFAHNQQHCLTDEQLDLLFLKIATMIFEQIFLRLGKEYKPGFVRYVTGAMTTALQTRNSVRSVSEEEADLRFVKCLHDELFLSSEWEMRQAADDMTLVKHFFDTFRSLVKKIANVHFGRTLEKEEMSGRVVPYRFANVPSNTVFGHPFESLCFQYITALVYGVQQEQVLQFAKEMHEKAVWHASHLNESYEDSPSASTSIEVFGCLPREVPILLPQIMEKLDDDIENRLYVEAWTTRCVTRNASSISASPVDLVASFSNFTGVSGTPSLVIPPSFHSSESTFMDRNVVPQVLEAVLGKETSIHTLQAKMSLEELVDRVLDYSPQLTAIIDVGALFKDYSAEHVARAILDQLHRQGRKEITGVVSFVRAHGSEAADYPAVFKSEAERPFLLKDTSPEELSKVGCVPGHYFMIYDQAHCVGTDAPHHSGAHALVTFDMGVALTQFVQGIMRLRGFLTMNQRIHILMPETVARKMGSHFMQNVQDARWGHALGQLIQLMLVTEARKEADGMYKLLKKMCQQAIFGVMYCVMTEEPLEGERIQEAYSVFSAGEELLFVATQDISYTVLGMLDKEESIQKVISEYVDRLQERCKVIFGDSSHQHVQKQICTSLMKVHREVEILLDYCPTSVSVPMDADGSHRQELGGELVREQQREQVREQQQEQEIDFDTEADRWREGGKQFNVVEVPWTSFDHFIDKTRDREYSVPIQSVFADLRYCHLYGQLFYTHFSLTQVFLSPYRESLSFFHKNARPVCYVFCHHMDEELRFVIVDQFTAERLVEAIKREDKKDCWMLTPTGEYFAGDPDACPTNDESFQDTMMEIAILSGAPLPQLLKYKKRFAQWYFNHQENRPELLLKFFTLQKLQLKNRMGANTTVIDEQIIQLLREYQQQ